MHRAERTRAPLLHPALPRRAEALLHVQQSENWGTCITSTWFTLRAEVPSWKGINNCHFPSGSTQSWQITQEKEKKKKESFYPVLKQWYRVLLKGQAGHKKKASAVLPKDTNFIQNAVEKSVAKGIAENQGDLSGERLRADWYLHDTKKTGQPDV